MQRSNEIERVATTLREVADLAGVHPATVSRALNPDTRDRVNAKTAVRVDEAARTLGYRVNRLARGLKMRRSLTAGVLIPDLTNPFFPPIVRGIEDRLQEDGYTALLTNTDGDPQRARKGLETLLDRQVDGLILATATREDALVADAAAAGLPVVLVNRRVDQSDVPAVVPDDVGGVHAAVEHLVGLGHRRIAHIAGPLTTSTGHLRREGFLASAGEYGLDVADLVRVADSFTETAGTLQALALLRAHRDITAIVAGNDLIALGCLDALVTEGRRCPDDVSLVGFNDMPFIDKVSPPLTTVHVPHYELGQRAADLLLGRLQDRTRASSQLVVGVRLIVRDSTAPAS